MKLSDKYKVFMRHSSKVDILEGTTFAGKTTVGLVKYMLKVAQSKKKLHVLAGRDKGTIEKNLINSELGIKTVFGSDVDYRGKGDADITNAHIKYKTPNGEKIIFVYGYDTKERWEKILGGQYGCVFIDEVNIADTGFVDEITARQDYMLMTLNPDNPDLYVYKNYINHSRPLEKLKSQTPQELLAELNEEAYKDWIHWYFNFNDNVGITAEKIEQLLLTTPKGTKIYKNKILGLRGRATGLVFPHFGAEHIKDGSALQRDIECCNIKFNKFSCGVDTSYSQNTGDRFVFIFKGFTVDKRMYVLDELVFNNEDRVKQGKKAIAPSDIPPLLFKFLEQNRKLWGLSRDVFIDSADSATLTECNKYKRQTGCIYNFVPAWKKRKIIDRITLVSGWLAQGYYFVLSHCKHTINELNNYAWAEGEDDVPEDKNDHCINADQYAWLPHVDKVGGYKME